MLDIIIPIKNCTGLLTKSLTELLPQLEDGDRVIIGDHGSIDGLNEDFFPDNEKIFYLKSFSTETKIINEAIKYYCNNQYVMILDPRCVPLPDFLIKIKKELEEDLVILCKVDEIDGQGKICATDKRFLKNKADPTMCRMYCFCFPRRKALDVGLFNEFFNANNSYTHGVLFCKHLKEYTGCRIHGITQFSCVYRQSSRERGNKEQELHKNIKYKNPQIELYRRASIIIPTDNLDSVSHLLDERDEIISFNAGTSTICKKIYEAIQNSKHDFIILLNPEGRHRLCNTIRLFKDFYEPHEHPFLISDPNEKYYTIYEGNLVKKVGYHQIDNFTSMCFSKDILPIIDPSLHTNLVSIMKGIASNGEIEMVKGIITGKKGRGKIVIIENIPPVMNKIAGIENIPAGRRKKKIKPVKRHDANLEVIGDDDIIVNGQNRLYTFLIPYMHREERFVLLKKCLEKLPISKDNIQICIHEVGPERGLDDDFIKDYTYLYTKFDGLFNRAWAINRGIREMATGEILILMDGDLIVDTGWLNEIFSYTKPAVAWGKIYFLNENNTKKYIDTGEIDIKNYRKLKVPNIWGAAGGATFIPRKIFFDLRGIPEIFDGWGGEDNVFLSKLHIYGYQLQRFNSILYHLFHKHRSKGVKDVVNVCQQVLKWDEQQWTEYNKKVGDNWGQPVWRRMSI